MAHRHTTALSVMLIVVRSMLAALLIGAAVVVLLIAILGTIGGGIPLFMWGLGLGLLLLGAMCASIR